METQRHYFNEMIATECCYITQSAEVEDKDRLFFTRRPLMSGESVEDWKEVTPEYKAEVEARLAELNPIK